MAAFNAKTAAATTAPPAPIAQPAPAQAAPVPAQMDINSLLKVLQQNQLAQAKAQQPQPQAQPQTQPNISSLENIFNQFRDPNQAALPQNAQLPQAATAPAPIPAAAAPPNPALNPAAQTLDWQKLLNVMSLQQQMQPAVTPPPTQAAQGPDLASVLAQLNPGMQQQQQQTSHPYGADQQQAPEPYENPERKRYRESGGRTDGDDSSHGHSKRFRANGEPTKPKKHVSKRWLKKSSRRR